jgi:hypothetical protein
MIDRKTLLNPPLEPTASSVMDDLPSS